LSLPWGLWSGSQADINSNPFVSSIKCLIDSIRTKFHDIPIYIVYKDTAKHASKIARFMEHDNYDDNTSFFAISQLSDIYLRGAMPLPLQSRKGIKGVYSPIFYNDDKCKECKVGYRKYAFYEHIAALEIAEVLDIPIRYLSEKGGGYWFENCEDESDGCRAVTLNADELVHNGEIGFISDVVFNENCIVESNKNNFIEKLQNMLHLKTLIPVPKFECKDGTEYMALIKRIRFLNQGVLLVKDKLLDKALKEKNIELKSINYDLDYLRLGNTIFGLKDQCESLREICPNKDITYIQCESKEVINSNAWIF
jgi:hypothetical protein